MKNTFLFPLSLITVFGLNGMVKDPVTATQYAQIDSFLRSTLDHPMQAEIQPSAALLWAKLGLERKLQEGVSLQTYFTVLTRVGKQEKDLKAKFDALTTEGELLVEGKIGARTAKNIEQARKRLKKCTNQSLNPVAQARSCALLGSTYIEGPLGNENSKNLVEAERLFEKAKNQTVDPSASAEGQLGLAQVNIARKKFRLAYQHFQNASQQTANMLVHYRAQACMGQMQAKGLVGHRKKTDHKNAITLLEPISKLPVPKKAIGLPPTRSQFLTERMKQGALKTLQELQ
ncbi:hypothetical protein A3F06_03895 [candidate division TM6 bacterium RIFCSPHIGHO2_12_FULL_36_22]|nr:MAG: hypothetical protein A3F06_03895 [candidate division TM6 bacterium RIFCSPHIGHO2_12_FULL_36_22]